MRTKKENTEYIFQLVDGPPLTEEEFDEIARMIASWIYRDLRYKKESAIIPKEDTHA
jgi:hypothetical protein